MTTDLRCMPVAVPTIPSFYHGHINLSSYFRFVTQAIHPFMKYGFSFFFFFNEIDDKILEPSKQLMQLKHHFCLFSHFEVVMNL